MCIKHGYFEGFVQKFKIIVLRTVSIRIKCDFRLYPATTSPTELLVRKHIIFKMFETLRFRIIIIYKKIIYTVFVPLDPPIHICIYSRHALVLQLSL